jgi:hypothetical protein
VSFAAGANVGSVLSQYGDRVRSARVRYHSQIIGVCSRREGMPNGVLRALLLGCALMPATSMAQQPSKAQPQLSYSYVELAYDESDFDVGGARNVDGDGFTLSGSFRINDDWHAFASYGNDDLDFGINLHTWEIGAGYRYPVRNNVDLYGRVLYIRRNANLTGPLDGDDDGLGLQFRVRGRLNQRVELEGGIQYVDVGGTDTSLQGSARYHFTKQLSAAVGLTLLGDHDGIGVSARYSF